MTFFFVALVDFAARFPFSRYTRALIFRTYLI